MKLTIEIRQAITKNVLSDCFDKRIEKLHKEFGKFTAVLYQEAMGGILPKIKNLPDGIIRKAYSFEFKFAGEDARLGLADEVPTKGSHRYAQNYSGPEKPWAFGNDVIKFSAKSPETATFQRITNAYTAILEEKGVMRAKIFGSLEALKTVKQLLTEWPEVEKFLPEGSSVKDQMIPMIPVNEINAMIENARAAR